MPIFKVSRKLFFLLKKSLFGRGGRGSDEKMTHNTVRKKFITLCSVYLSPTDTQTFEHFQISEFKVLILMIECSLNQCQIGQGNLIFKFDLTNTIQLGQPIFFIVTWCG